MSKSDVNKDICLFCGQHLQGEHKSKEHVFPKWLIKHLNLQGVHFYHSKYTSEAILDEKKEYKGFGKFTSILICRECNNGWLSRLESRSKPLLMPLIDGIFKGDLSTESSQIIAFWAYKTVLTLASASIQGSIIPPEHYSYVFENQFIPSRILIAMASVELSGDDDFYWIYNGNWSGRSSQVSQKEINEFLKNSYKITIRAGKVAWRVIHFPKDNIPPVGWYEYRDDARKWIYPISKNVKWPPHDRITDLFEFDTSLVYLDNIIKDINFNNIVDDKNVGEKFLVFIMGKLNAIKDRISGFSSKIGKY